MIIKTGKYVVPPGADPIYQVRSDDTGIDTALFGRFGAMWCQCTAPKAREAQTDANMELLEQDGLIIERNP